MAETISVQANVSAPVSTAWTAFVSPEAITTWNFASPDWHCPSAEVDLRVGGRHVARMEAKDGSMGFDYEGTYEEIEAERRIVLRLGDGRGVVTTFEPANGDTLVRTDFDADPAAPHDMQQAGWQAILDNYANYVARHGSQ